MEIVWREFKKVESFPRSDFSGKICLHVGIWTNQVRMLSVKREDWKWSPSLPVGTYLNKLWHNSCHIMAVYIIMEYYTTVKVTEIYMCWYAMTSELEKHSTLHYYLYNKRVWSMSLSRYLSICIYSIGVGYLWKTMTRSCFICQDPFRRQKLHNNLSSEALMWKMMNNLLNIREFWRKL